MIVETEFGVHISGKKLISRSSDAGVLIHKIGTEEYYDVAVDLEGSGFEYEETDRLIEEPEE